MKIDHESLIGTFEQKKALVQGFNLMDDDFFAVVMRDEKAFEVMLRILLQRDDLVVTDVRTQYELRNIVGHSVVLDGYATDSEGKLYNVEVQVRNNDYHPKRMRYYQANMDMSVLEKGKNYSELPELYLIFISTFDLFKMGRIHYSVKRILDNSEVEVSNGVHELYFNTEVKDNSEISKLLQYFENTDPENKSYDKLSERVEFYKTTSEGVKHMCEAVKNYGDERESWGMAKGQEKGEAKTVVINVKNLMENSKCTLEKALAMLGYKIEDYEKSLKIVEEMNK